MLRVTTATLIALMSTGAASAEGAYIGYGFANVNAKQSVHNWASTNAILVLGYEVNDYLSLEGETSITISEGQIIYSGISIDMENEHLGAFAKLTLPTSGSIKPYARLGMVRGSYSMSSGGASFNAPDASAFAYGFGAEWEYSENKGIRLDYAVADFDITDSEIIAITSVYRF